MFSRSALVAVLLIGAAVPLAACTPVASLNGFVAVDAKPEDVKVGESRTAVSAKLGSPSTVSAFDKNTWYYITQTSDKMAYLNPVIKTRDVISIRFDKEDKVSDVKVLSLKDGYDLAYEKRETPTRGKQLNWVEQLLGNVGRGGTMLPDDIDPGQRPGQGGGGSQPH